MALTDAPTVRNIGGLNEADAFNLFRLADDASLNALIVATIADASSWLTLRAPADYADPEPNKRAMFKRAEGCLTLHFLFLPLKARKTLGTHFPYASEDSSRFEELIQVDWYEQMRSLIEVYLIVDNPEKPFAAPCLVLGGIIDRSQAGSASSGILDESQKLNKILDEATALSVPPIPRTTVGGE